MVELNKSKTTKTNSKNKTTNHKKSKKTKKSKSSNLKNSLTIKGYKSKKTNSKKINYKKTKSKRKKIRGEEQIGGNIQDKPIQFEKPDNITSDSLFDDFLNIDKINLTRGLRNFSHFVNLVDWEVNKKFINKTEIPNDNKCQKIIKKSETTEKICYLHDEKCKGICGRYYSKSKGTCECYPIKAIKKFENGNDISININGESKKFKIFKIIEIHLLLIGARNIIILGDGEDCYVVFPFGIEKLEENMLTVKINETITEIENIAEPFKNLFLCGHSMGSALAMATSIHENFIKFKNKNDKNIYLILTGCLLYFNKAEKELFDDNYKKKYIALNVSSINIETNVIKNKAEQIQIALMFYIHKDLTSRRVLNITPTAQASKRAQGYPDNGMIDIKEFLITDNIELPNIFYLDLNNENYLSDNLSEIEKIFKSEEIYSFNEIDQDFNKRFSPEIFNILKNKILEIIKYEGENYENYIYKGTRNILNIVDYYKKFEKTQSVKGKNGNKVFISYRNSEHISKQLHTFDIYLKPLIDLITR